MSPESVNRIAGGYLDYVCLLLCLRFDGCVCACVCVCGVMDLEKRRKTEVMVRKKIVKKDYKIIF